MHYLGTAACGKSAEGLAGAAGLHPGMGKACRCWVLPRSQREEVKCFGRGTEVSSPNRRHERVHLMKILVVDDHVLIREALRGVLEELKPGARVLEASTCRQAMQLVEEHADVNPTLLNLSFPDRHG